MKYFSISELTHSDTAQRLLIDNTPSAVIKQNLTALVDNVLDPLREAWGKPISVSSGYRSQKLNKAVGGASTSQHLWGMAADLQVGDKATTQTLFELAQKLRLPYDQLIYEAKGKSVWLHVSYSQRNRRQVLRIIK